MIYEGARYQKKNCDPSNKVWQMDIQYKNYRTRMGYFNDPLTPSIIYNMIREEIILEKYM